MPRLLFAERLAAIVAAARARDADLLETTVRVHAEQFLLDVIELARQDGTRQDAAR